MRREDGEGGRQNVGVGFSVPAEITQAARALIDLLLEEAADPTERRFLCCEEMEAERRSGRRWKVLREKLKLRGIGCCGSSWSSAALDGDDMGMADGEEEREAGVGFVCTLHHHDREMERTECIEEEEETPRVEEQDQEEEEPPRAEEEDGDDDDENQDTERRIRAGATEIETAEAEAMVRTQATMNLAAALAAERHLRATQDCETESGQPPFRVSLMALLEKEHEGGNGNDSNNNKKKKGSMGGEEWPSAGCCCVCMSREKGAAFIPCGHTFCRVCSRELWLNRGSCPLCNRQILEILDIF